MLERSTPSPKRYNETKLDYIILVVWDTHSTKRSQTFSKFFENSGAFSKFLEHSGNL